MFDNTLAIVMSLTTPLLFDPTLTHAKQVQEHGTCASYTASILKCNRVLGF